MLKRLRGNLLLPALTAMVGLLLAWPLREDPQTAWMGGALVGATLVGVGGVRRARLAQGGGLLLLLGLAMGQRLEEPLVGMALLISCVLVLLPPQSRRARRTQPTSFGTLLPVWVAGLVLATPAELPVPRVLPLGILAVVGAVELAAVIRVARRREEDLFSALLASPAHLLVASFAALALVGTALLLLPFSSTGSGSISFVDALFTSVSAACVTGLGVLDTPKDFTGVGQAVILGLIQVGGLGIMTFATAASVLLGRRMGVREEAMAMDMLGVPDARADLERALSTVFKVTFIVEAVGALLLTALFLGQGEAFPSALWRGVFTSISAFCNAGFALQSDSLLSYQEAPAILLTTSALIVLGGLGPAVVAAVILRRRSRLSLQARLVLSATAMLLVLPILPILALEWNHTLGGLALGDRLVNAWFQSVTLRTAGFNAIDIGALSPATWTLCLVLMFIGGSPGSTAGGIKTTTMAMIAMAAAAAIRGHREAEAFGRSIPHRVVYEAVAVITLFTVSAVAALIALQLTQEIALDRALFEVVSALATVGLSMGATGELDGVGKLIIIACMFAGRVGPLSLSILLIGRSRPPRRYPLEAVSVG